MSVISFSARSTQNVSSSLLESAMSAGRRFGLRRLFDAAAAVVMHVQRQRAIAELQALDDYHLKDIGIARCEIWYRVNHPQDR